MPKRTKPIEPELAGFPERLRSAREELHLGVRELGELSKMDGARVSRYERGQKVDGVTADSVVALAKALNVRPAWLLTGEQPRRDDGAFIWVQRTPELVEALREALDRSAPDSARVDKARG